MTPQRVRSYLFIGLVFSACTAVALIDRRATERERVAVDAFAASRRVTEGLIHEREVSDGLCIARIP